MTERGGRGLCRRNTHEWWCMTVCGSCGEGTLGTAFRGLGIGVQCFWEVKTFFGL